MSNLLILCAIFVNVWMNACGCIEWWYALALSHSVAQAHATWFHGSTVSEGPWDGHQALHVQARRQSAQHAAATRHRCVCRGYAPLPSSPCRPSPRRARRVDGTRSASAAWPRTLRRPCLPSAPPPPAPVRHTCPQLHNGANAKRLRAAVRLVAAFPLVLYALCHGLQQMDGTAGGWWYTQSNAQVYIDSMA